MCLQHCLTTIFIRLITGFNFARRLFTASFPILLPGWKSYSSVPRMGGPHSEIFPEATSHTQSHSTGSSPNPHSSSFNLRHANCSSASAMVSSPFHDKTFGAIALMAHSDHQCRMRTLTQPLHKALLSSSTSARSLSVALGPRHQGQPRGSQSHGELGVTSSLQTPPKAQDPHHP